MIRPLNIYTISRINNIDAFNTVEKHSSQKENKSGVQFYEVESLRIFVDKLVRCGITISELDGFFYGFEIPQIGKEFDLLKFTDKSCVNIELKSTSVPEEKILNQLLKNRHYLNHLGKKIFLYTIITDSLTCYKLSLNDELLKVDFFEIVDLLRRNAHNYIEMIDGLFRASNYLVSPLNTPSKFIQGEYFLTHAQEQIKTELLRGIDNAFLGTYFHLTGRPGTGKTLLLYDVAKTLSKTGKTLLIHCGKLSEGQEKINEEIENLLIAAAGDLRYGVLNLEEYNYILVDESHRFYESQFCKICESVNQNDQICIFSSDPEQVLSSTEKRRAIVKRIRTLSLIKEFSLSEKIRTNKELHSFITRMRDLKHKPKKVMDYSSVSLNYANTVVEAQKLLEYYRENGYVFINYSKSNFVDSPYACYEEDYDTHHVIGQEFDKVVMLMDKSFYYDECGVLNGVPHPNPNYLYPNLFYQGITRVREELAIVVVDAPDLFQEIVSILE